MMKRQFFLPLFAFLALAPAALGCGGCTEGADGNQPPTVVVSGAPAGAFVVGETMYIQIDATDPEGGALTFDWDHKPKNLNWTVQGRAKFLPSSNSALFEWDPLASDSTNDEPIQLIFIVTDDAGNSTEKVVTVNIVPGNGVPAFQSNASELYDPRSGKPLEFEVRVTDQDSEQVTLDMDRAAAPAGAVFDPTGPYSGVFRWTPTVEQLERRVHTATFTAEDDDNPVVSFKVTIVIRTATAIAIDKDQTDQSCPGEAVIAHTPLGPQRSAIEPYRFEATLKDPRFDEMILYWTFTDAYNGDFDPSDESKKMTSIPMDDQAGTWVAELAPQASVINPEIGALTIFYQICAFDNDASGLDAIACTPSSGDLELYYAFTAYLPDAEDCVEDALDMSSAPNDSFDTASQIGTRWSQFRACPAGPDFHSVEVRPGETALIAAVYPDGSNINVSAFDGSRAPIQLKESACTGMSTVEVSVPMGGSTTNYYVQVEGDNVAYQLRAFKSGSASGCADQGNEPNDTSAQATPVTDGQTVNAEICNGTDLDVYAVQLGAGDNLTVTNRFTNASGNLDMTLYSPSQAGDISPGGTGVKFTYSFEDEEVLEYVAEEAGTYYLLVFNNDGGANPYTLTFDIGAPSPCPDSDQFTSAGENHTEASAALLDSTDGEHTYSALEVCPGKPDWYKRTEFNGALVLGELTVTGGTGTLDDVTLKVFDANDNLVGAGSPATGRIDFDYTPQTTGVHYIKVETTARVVYELVILR